MKKIVITGGAGFIGSNIAAALEESTDGNIVISDLFGTDDKWRNLAKRQRTDIVHPTLLLEWLDENKDSVEAIIHMGAISETTVRDADLVVETNFQLSKRLFMWSAQNNCRLIYASSAATYGDGKQGFADHNTIEAYTQLRPLNLYGWSKHFFDMWVLNAQQNKEPLPKQWVGLKFFNVYGPNEYHKGHQQSVVSKVFPVVKARQTVELFQSSNPAYKDGEQLRDFIYVKDCTQVVLWLLKNPHVSGIYNVGTGQARSFKDLAHAVFDALNVERRIHYIAMPEALKDKYQYFTQADMSNLTSVGCDVNFTSLENGVKDYVLQYLNQEDPYK